MGRSKTPAEALKRLRDMKKKNPDYKWKNPLAGYTQRRKKLEEEAKKRREYMRTHPIVRRDLPGVLNKAKK